MDEARRGTLAARDVDELLHAVVADVGQSMDLWSVDLWTFSDDVDTLRCRAYWSRDAIADKGGGCVGAVVGLDQSHDLRRLVLAAEVVEKHIDDDLSPPDGAALLQAGFATRVDIPLLAGAEVLGILSLAEKRGVRRLSPDDRTRLRTLAHLAAAVLRAVRLYEMEGNRAARLVGLLTSGHGLSSSLAAPEIAAAARAEAAQLLPGVVCGAGVFLRRDDGTFVRLGPPARDMPPAWRADAVARQAIERRRPERARTAAGDARLVLPLDAGGCTIGYLELTAPLKRQFRDREVELAMLLAEQTAAAFERSRTFRALEGRAATDALTGLYSRWYFYERLYAEVARAQRYRQPLALVVAELDGEEQIAKAKGPVFRDAVLVAVARLLQTSLRDKVDVACRLGGGRFALLLPNTSDAAGAAGVVVERVRARVAEAHLYDDDLGTLGRFTMSIGVAGYPDVADDADELAGVAETRLEKARAAGGDRVEPPFPVLDGEAEADDGAVRTVTTPISPDTGDRPG